MDGVHEAEPVMINEAALIAEGFVPILAVGIKLGTLPDGRHGFTTRLVCAHTLPALLAEYPAIVETIINELKQLPELSKPPDDQIRNPNLTLIRTTYTPEELNGG